MQTLYHPGIVRVYDYGYYAENSQAWYVMDLVTGEDSSSVTPADVYPGADETKRLAGSNAELSRYMLQAKMPPSGKSSSSFTNPS